MVGKDWIKASDRMKWIKRPRRRNAALRIFLAACAYQGRIVGWVMPR